MTDLKLGGEICPQPSVCATLDNVCFGFACAFRNSPVSKGLSEEEEREWAVEVGCPGFHHPHPPPQWCGARASPLVPLSLGSLTCNIQIVTQTHGVLRGKLIPKYGSHEWSSGGAVPPMLTRGWSCLCFNKVIRKV